jgi:hypothetical protein
MDYSILNEKKIGDRYRSLSTQVRDALDSRDIVQTTERIARFHNIPTERIDTLKQLTSMVLLGFVSVDELPREIGENLHLNFLHSNAITKELYAEVFEGLEDDIKKSYSPIKLKEEDENSDLTDDKGKSVSSRIEIDNNENKNTVRIPINTSISVKKEDGSTPTSINIPIKDTDPKTVPIKSAPSDTRTRPISLIKKDSLKDAPSSSDNDDKSKPLIIYKGSDSHKQEKNKFRKTKKRFSIPFGFFGIGSGSQDKTPQAVSARINKKSDKSNTNNILGTITKREPKKVVHYSNARTPVSPFQGDSENIFQDEKKVNEKNNDIEEKGSFSWPDDSISKGS